MSLVTLERFPKSRLKALLDHFADIDDPREPWRVAFRLQKLLLLVVCGTICDCEDYHEIAAWATRIPRCCAAMRPTIMGCRPGAG